MIDRPDVQVDSDRVFLRLGNYEFEIVVPPTLTHWTDASEAAESTARLLRECLAGGPAEAQIVDRSSLQRQYDVAVRRNKGVPDSFSLAPRRQPTPRDAHRKVRPAAPGDPLPEVPGYHHADDGTLCPTAARTGPADPVCTCRQVAPPTARSGDSEVSS